MSRRVVEVLVQVDGPERDMDRFVRLCDESGLIAERLGSYGNFRVEITMVNVAKCVARESAVSQIVGAVGEQLSIQVVESSLIHAESNPLVYFHVHAPVPLKGARLYKILAPLGRGALDVVVAVPMVGDEDARKSAAAERIATSPIIRAYENLSGDLYLRQASGSASAATPKGRLALARATTLYVTMVALLLGAGVLARQLWGGWGSFAVTAGSLAVLALAWWASRWLVFDVEERRSVSMGVVRFLLVGVFFAFGVEFPVALLSVRGLMLATFEAAAGLCVAFGMQKFFYIPGVRGAIWAAVGTLGLGVGVVPWIANVLWSAFFESFGVPGRVSGRGVLMDLAMPSRPLFALALMIIFASSILGYLYFFRALNGGGLLAVFQIALVVPVYFLGLVVFSLQQVESDVAEVESSSASFRAPSPSHMLQLARVCLSVEEDKGVVGHPVPITRPVVLFPTTDDRVWVWEPPEPGNKAKPERSGPPDAGRTISVPLDNVNVQVVPDGKKVCS